MGVILLAEAKDPKPMAKDNFPKVSFPDCWFGFPGSKAPKLLLI